MIQPRAHGGSNAFRGPGAEREGNLGSEKRVCQAQNEGKNALCQEPAAGALDHVPPQGHIVTVKFHTSSDLHQPGEANPGARAVAKRVENLADEAIGTRWDVEVHAAYARRYGARQTVAGDVHIYPIGLFSQRDV